ncbi:hypothetical protein K437DRAFT_293854 [Tilletiaria anomala UBC 951]|uniref:CAP-Gly domain-containing protein n=1 Tax=Tilletiaria anomala (strain ATCC 24038 / CBS 436.72 / UBC 951) TaxID=1037660 RepID=A0A066WBP7_TILAU|nr:uncharacterized protein K437DRAFT_293854 [Tilletiaria anomala UBC 951]KDN48519.1 hypothetical protein K437DRAFT_293854 [Tilletiaria anomala UBC 951]
MSPYSPQIGDLVDAGIRPNITVRGHLRYMGSINGKDGLFAGIELVETDVKHGKNNGTVFGRQYFTTRSPTSGLFIPISKLSSAMLMEFPTQDDGPRPASSLSRTSAMDERRELGSRSATPSSGLRSRPSIPRLSRHSVSRSSYRPIGVNTAARANHVSIDARMPESSRPRTPSLKPLPRPSSQTHAFATPLRLSGRPYSSKSLAAGNMPPTSLAATSGVGNVRTPLRARASVGNLPSRSSILLRAGAADENMLPPRSPSKGCQLERERLAKKQVLPDLASVSRAAYAGPLSQVHNVHQGVNIGPDGSPENNIHTQIRANAERSKEMEAVLRRLEEIQISADDWRGMALLHTTSFAMAVQSNWALQSAASRRAAAPKRQKSLNFESEGMDSNLNVPNSVDTSSVCAACSGSLDRVTALATSPPPAEEVAVPDGQSTPMDGNNEVIASRVIRLEENLADALNAKEEQEKYFRAKLAKLAASEQQYKNALIKAKDELAQQRAAEAESRTKFIEMENAMASLQAAFEDERQKVEELRSEDLPESVSSAQAVQRPPSSLGEEVATSTQNFLVHGQLGDENEATPCDDCGETDHKLEDCPYAAAIF